MIIRIEIEDYDLARLFYEFLLEEAEAYFYEETFPHRVITLDDETLKIFSEYDE